MNIPDIIYPGFELDEYMLAYRDQKDYQDARELLKLMKENILDASVALRESRLMPPPISIDQYEQLEYMVRRASMFSHAVLYATDTFVKSTAILAKSPDCPAEVVKINGELPMLFPYATAIRDSAHHTEDRVRGVLNRYGKRTPEDQPMTRAFSNKGIGYTNSDGNFRSLEIGPTLVELITTFNRIIQAYPWIKAYNQEGPIIVKPYR